MEFSGYMTINGQNQGNIEGSSQRRERQQMINLFDFDHAVSLPFQSHRNLANGSVVHQPVVVTKEIDKSTPKLYQALVEKETLLQVVLEWYRFDGKGEENVYFKIQLENAHIAKIAPWTPGLSGQEHNEHLRFMERISFFYETIAWSWGPDGDIAFQTSWKNEGA
jgi:type VI secretion system secreted protein Hcp